MTNDKQINELKPCPFCGSIDTYRGECEEGDVIGCGHCNATGPVMEEIDVTVPVTLYSWQSRPIEDTLRAQIAALTARAERAEGERDEAIKNTDIARTIVFQIRDVLQSIDPIIFADTIKNIG